MRTIIMLVAPAVLIAIAVVVFYVTAPRGVQSTPRKLIRGSMAGLLTLGVFLVAGALLVRALRPKHDIQSALMQANQLIANVGGGSKVCNEARQLFKRYESAEEKFVRSSDMVEYPAISALVHANVDGIANFLPNSPPQPHIYIRIGNHRDGYAIVIVGTDVSGKFVQDPAGVKVADSCIFIHE